MFNELYEAERNKIEVNAVLVVEGKINHDEFSGGLRIIADRLMTAGEARARYAKHLLLRMNGAADSRRLKSLLAPFAPGAAQVRISYRNADAECELVLGDSLRVRLDDSLLEALDDWLQAGNVRIVYH